MKMQLKEFDLKLKHPFTIARGTTTVQHMLVVELQEGEHFGYGEAPGYKYYGASIESMRTALSHSFPVFTFHRLLDELNAQLFECFGIRDCLFHTPSTVGIHADNGICMFAEFFDDFNIVGRAEFYFVDIKVGIFFQFLNHHFNRIDANGNVRLR